MAGAGTEVGRISIKVTPDTDDFRRQLKQQLEAIEKSLHGQIPVKVDVDANGARSKLAGTLAGMKTMVGKGVSVPVTTDDSTVKDVWRNLRAGMVDLGRLAQQAGKSVAAYKNEIKRMTLEQQKVSPLLNHDLAVLRSNNEMRKRGMATLREFASALRDQQNWLKQSNPTLTDNQVKWRVWGMAIRDANDNATSAFRNFKNALKGMSGGDNGASFLQKLIPGLKMTGKEFEQAESSAGRAGRTFLGLTRISWMVGAGFAGAAPAVGLISGLIAGLPSLMMTFGAAAGAIAMGLDGIKAAAETVSPQWDAMREVISKQWQDGLTPILGNLAEKVFPVMQTGMGQVTTGLLDMAKSVSGALTSAQGVTQLETIFSGIGGFFTSISPAMGQFTQSFLTLGAAGAQSMGHLTGFISTFASQWQNMVTTVVSDGTFDQAMAGMAQGLSGFTGLFTQLMQSGLGAMAKLGEPLNNMFSGLGNLLSSAMPALTAFAGGVGNIIGNLSNSLAPAFAALEPVVSAIMPVFEQLATIIGGALSQALVTIAPVLTQFAQLMGPVLTQTFTALAPILQVLAETFAGVLLSAMQALAPIMPVLAQTFAQLATAIGDGLALVLPALVEVFKALLPAVMPLIPIMLQMVQAVIPLIPVLAQVVANFLRVIAVVAPILTVFGNLASIVAQVAVKLLELGVTIVSNVAGAFQKLVDIVLEKMSAFVNAIAEGGNKAVEKLREWGASAIGVITEYGSKFFEAGKNVIMGLVRGMGSMIGAAVNKVKEIGSAIYNAVTGFFNINSPSKVMDQLGQFTMEGFANGIESSGQEAIDRVKAISKAIFEAAKEVFGDAGGLNLAFNFGGGAGGAGGFGGLSNQISQATTNMKGFESSVAGAMNPTTKMTDDVKAQTRELSRQLDLLEMRRKELEMAKDNVDKKSPQMDAIKAELDQIRQQKLALGYQKDQLQYAQKYEGQVESTNQKYDEQLKTLANMPVDFAKTTVSGALNDFGIGGGGALGAIADYGMELGSKFVFNVNSVDEAMAAKDREVNKQGRGVVGR